MDKIEGVRYIKRDEYALFFIYNLSEDIKNIIRDKLTFICFGKSASESTFDMHKYRATLKEFLRRYENKSKGIKIGMMGEFLAHIIFNRFFKDFYVASPFFNIEERSIKKGFDVVLYKEGENIIWLTEVKSGELNSTQTTTSKTSALLSKAKIDLTGQLMHEDNQSTWYNALNGAKQVFSEHNDLKIAVAEILDDYFVKSEGGKVALFSEINAILVSNVFSESDNHIDELSVKNKREQFVKEKSFNRIFVLSSHKNTYDQIYQFLKEESENEENRFNSCSS